MMNLSREKCIPLIFINP